MQDPRSFGRMDNTDHDHDIRIVVLVMKSLTFVGRGPDRRGWPRRWLLRAREDSLRRLDVDHIDLFRPHRPGGTR